MANYRTELDALNALVNEQRKTNELLEKLMGKRDEDGCDNKLEETTTHKRGNGRGGNNSK